MYYSPEEILEQLKSSPFWQTRSRTTPNTIQNLICPACGDKTAFAYTKSPLAVVCNRKSACGISTKMPEILNLKPVDFAKKYASTSDPHRPAREYLKTRGLNNSLRGLEYEFWPKARGNSGGAVMFKIGTDKEGKQVYNGRLLRPGQDGKTHNKNSTAGLIFRHPAINYSRQSKPICLTEGVIDCLSLIEAGQPAVAILSAGTKPGSLNIPQSWKIRICFDADRAGLQAISNYKLCFPEAEVLLPDRPGGTKDWNDILLEIKRGIKA